MSASLLLSCMLSCTLSCLLHGPLPPSAPGVPAANAMPAAPAAGDAAALPAAPQAELVTVVYDLDRVWSAPRAEQAVARTTPFPFDDDDTESEDGDAEDFPVDALMTFLWSVVAPGEFEYEGRQMTPEGDHALRITAPAAVQADVRATLEHLAAAAQRRARLDIDIWRTTGDGLLPEALDGPALAAAETAGTLLRLAGRHEELRLGRTERRDALTHTPFLRDWDTEIAQQATLAQPQFELLQLGTSLRLRLEEQDAGHVTLRFLERISELRGMERRTEAMRSTVHTEGMSGSDVVAGALDQPVVAFATLAGSAVLAAGDECITLAHAQTLDGPVGYVVRHRLVSLDPAPAPLALAGAPERTLRTADLSALQWPALGASAPTPGQYFIGAGGTGDDRVWLRFPADERRDLDVLVHQATWLPDRGDDGGAWLLGSIAVLGGDAAATGARHAALVAQRPPRRPLRLQLQLVESGRASPGRVVAQAVLPFCSGDTGVAVFGCARMLLTGFDVNVAQGCAVPDPRVGGCLDGLALRARAGADGSVELELLSHRALRRDRLDLRVPNFSPVDTVELALLSLAPRIAADGAWHELPDVAGGFDGTQLALRWKLGSP